MLALQIRVKFTTGKIEQNENRKVKHDQTFDEETVGIEKGIPSLADVKAPFLFSEDRGGEVRVPV